MLGGVAALIARSSCLVMSRRTMYEDLYRRSFLFKFEKWMHGYLSFALGNSKQVVENLIDEGIPQEKTGLIYNGIDILHYQNLIERSSARHKLNISNNSLVISILANLYRYKGHADLLDALALMKDHLPDGWLLLSIGRDQGELTGLRDKAVNLGLENHIRWLGFRKDSAEVLAASDFGVLCSHQEGFSNALLESMAIGLPMVVTDISGSNEAIKDHDNGRVVPISDPEALSQAILELAQSSEIRASMSKKTRERVATCFSLNRVVENYKKFYAAMMGESTQKSMDLDQIKDS